ncbi:hypothetical protein GCM10012275_26570 [Longimycelium tulufanense]|uniref:Uncharacterized protein n=1 Tax=Longimycelium tulufanense TaxID=907463 RepID=A0A8J3C8G0_9PSEU|nr:hypothetical protein GCM10012275_26570 [Longimycelium tulufanense]
MPTTVAPSTSNLTFCTVTSGWAAVAAAGARRNARQHHDDGWARNEWEPTRPDRVRGLRRPTLDAMGYRRVDMPMWDVKRSTAASFRTSGAARSGRVAAR